MKVLVVGGTGFVGKALTRQLVGQGADIVCVCRRKPDSYPGQVVEADRTEIQRLRAKFESESFDFVVDTCAMNAKHADLFTALQDTAKTWIHISSGAVYSDVHTASFDEGARADGAEHWGAYGQGKSDLERTLRHAATGSCQLSMVRAPYLYGPGNSSDREQFFFRHALNNKTILVPSRETVANFVYIDDFAKDLITLGKHRSVLGADVINLSSDRPITLLDFAKSCVAACEADPALVEVVNNEKYQVASRKFFPFRTNNLVLTNDHFKEHLPPPYEESGLEQGLKAALKSYPPEAMKMTGQPSQEMFESAKTAVEPSK